MGVSNQLRSVIEWTDPDPGLLFLKWTEDGDEIKNASKLIVGPGQGCIFVYEGQVQAVYDTEGLINLETDNIPFWTTIKKALQKMESEHKVGLFYFRRAEMTNVRWGTPSPIKYLDPQFKFPVGLGAFGNYSLKIVEAQKFFLNIVAGAAVYSVKEIQQLILSRITALISDILGKAKFSYIDVDGNRAEISAAVVQQVTPVFRDLGFQLTDFRIEGTSFDEDTMTRIGRIADLAAEGQAAAAAGVDFKTLKQLEALQTAAETENSVAGLGVAVAAGAQLGQALGGQAAQPQAPPAGPVGAPQAAAGASEADDPAAKLAKLKKLRDADLITEEEYAAKKKEILDAM